MGFSWAVYLAQQATTAAPVEATGIAENELLYDRQVNLCLEHGPGLLVFFDNVGLVGKHRGEVDHVNELCSRGMLTNELCLASRCDILGIELDGERLRTRAASAKYEEVGLALHWVLEQRRDRSWNASWGM